MTPEIDAIHAYSDKHSTCDIQKHPWEAVFGAGFDAGRKEAEAALESAQAEGARLRETLEWYGDKNNYTLTEGIFVHEAEPGHMQSLSYSSSPVSEDLGRRARATLEAHLE